MPILREVLIVLEPLIGEEEFFVKGNHLGKPMLTLLVELRNEFRRWYSALSVQEIMTNPDLILAVERIEKSLNEAISHTSTLR